MRNCQKEPRSEKPEVRDPPPKGPTGLAPSTSQEVGQEEDAPETGPLPAEAPPDDGCAGPEVRDPPPKGPTG